MTTIESRPASESMTGQFEPPTPEVNSVPFEAATHDVMGGAARLEVRVHEHGFVALVDAMPRLVPDGQTADAAIVQAARVSYGQGTKRVNEDRGLLRYLMRHRHTTPFEMVEFKFHMAMPIFVARQWIRHRTANVNEYSGRYSIIPDQFWHPTVEDVRQQSATNRQGGDEPMSAQGIEGIQTAQQFVDYLDRAAGLYPEYETLLEQGVSRELARVGLPLSAYTQWYWKCDLHNILHFLELRLDPHAQREIREYAEAMYALIEPIVPVTMEAFRDYRLEGLNLTRLEIDAIRAKLRGDGDGSLDSKNKRERDEWEQKRGRLGLD
ncbi:MAG: FAD-dependent thymidylate synthase [Dehalococcoidia bacterium]